MKVYVLQKILLVKMSGNIVIPELYLNFETCHFKAQSTIRIMCGKVTKKIFQIGRRVNKTR